MLSSKTFAATLGAVVLGMAFFQFLSDHHSTKAEASNGLIPGACVQLDNGIKVCSVYKDGNTSPYLVSDKGYITR